MRTHTSYNALEHTITIDGGWPICARCDQPGSHEECLMAEDTGIPEVTVGPAATRAWLATPDPDQPHLSQAQRYLDDTGRPDIDHADQLVDDAFRAGVFGPRTQVVLWADRDPATGAALGWHLTIAVTVATGEVLRLASTWQDMAQLHCPEHDPAGVDGLVALLELVTAETTAVLRNALAFLTPAAAADDDDAVPR